MKCRECGQVETGLNIFCDECWAKNPASSKGPILHSRDMYCGQCGEFHAKGTPWNFEHNCTKGRLVTDVRYCIWCGSPFMEGHKCGLHELRDFWLKGVEMPIDYNNYPSNWREISKERREAAGWKCEFCGIANGTERISATSGKPYKVVLTVAHLNHDTNDNRPENLKALCQPCHLSYDASMHGRHAKETKQRKKREQIAASGQMELI